MVKIVRSSVFQSQPDSEQITDPARIARLLKQLSKHYSPLTVQIHDHKGLYTSCIVKVDKPYVLLDELIPSSGHEKLVSERKIRATGKLDGVEIQFTTTLKRVKEQKNMLTYYMKLPKTLKYQQRRQAYRVPVPAMAQLRVIVDYKDNRIIVGELHDLSHGGAGKIIPEGKITIDPGQLYECAIELPCGEWIYCSVEICYQKNIPSRKRQLIGVRFNDITLVQSRIIGRCISELELEQIRKRAMF